MKFTVPEIIYTGWQQRTNKEGRAYELITYLDPDSGNTFSTMCNVPIPPTLKQLDRVKAEFELIVGKYTSCKTVALEKL